MDNFLLIILGMIWGSSFLFMRIVAPITGPIVLVQWRLVFATLALLPFVVRAKRPKNSEYQHFLIVGLLQTAAPFFLLSYASVTLSAGFTSIFNATAPLFSALCGALFFRELLSLRQKTGIVLGFVGVWILLADKFGVKSENAQLLLPVLGGLAAGLSYGLAANYNRKFLHGVRPHTTAFWSCLMGALMLLPLSYDQAWIFAYEPNIVWSVVALGVLCSAIAFIIYFTLIKKKGATGAALVTFLVPIFACFWGWIFLGETITLKMIMGAGVVFWGIYRMLSKSRK